MDVSRLNGLFGRRHTRRNAITHTGLGIGMAAVGASGFGLSASAQVATPTVGDDDGLDLPEGERTYTMFVQTARAGTWAATEEEGVYTLTLTGLPAQTVYFSDRPSRVVGTQRTADFLGALGFRADNPPNAALVTRSGNGEDDILVIELFNPIYTEGDGDEGATLVYGARILDNYVGTGLGRIALEQHDKLIPASFDGASLFIDDCADGQVRCYRDNKYIGTVTWGCCYKKANCRSCHGESDPYDRYCVTLAGCEDGQCGPGQHTVPCSILNW
jgi:hypothetical protein